MLTSIRRPTSRVVRKLCSVEQRMSQRNYSSISTEIPSKKFDITGKILPEPGSSAEVVHCFTQEDVTKFAVLTGDNNPLHYDAEFASKTPFGAPVVHGSYVGSLFSTIFGRSVHGSIYVNQTLLFKRPVMVGATVRARLEVTAAVPHAKRGGHLITCTSTVHVLPEYSAATDAEVEPVLAITGECQALIP